MNHAMLIGLAAMFSTQAMAAVSAPTPTGSVNPLDYTTPVSDDILAYQRGGFLFDGAEITIGADVKTILDGALALETTLNLSSAGNSTTQFVSSKLTLADAAALQTNLKLPSSAFGGAPVYLANQGQTAIVQRVDDTISNVIVNTASSISIAQQIDVSINLSSYQAFRTGISTTALSNSLSAAIEAATAASMGK